MATPTLDREQGLAHLAYPSLRTAAKMLGVAPSSLSRRDLPYVSFGGEKRLAPNTVMAEAVRLNRRDINEIAFDLVELAESEHPEAVGDVEHEITEFMRERERPSDGEGRPSASWLEEAKRFLPSSVFENVAEIYEQAAASESSGISGPAPARS